jgi:hypothetical protein
MIKGVTRAHLVGPIWYLLSLQMSPIPQISFLVGTFFAVSYSKPALAPIIQVSKSENSVSDLASVLSKWPNITVLMGVHSNKGRKGGSSYFGNHLP